MVAIRLATPADVPAIAAIMKREAEETTHTFTVHPRDEAEWLARFERSAAFYPWLVAVADAEVAGFAHAGTFRDNDAYAWTVEVSIYLKPEHQRQGLGSRLYGKLFSLLHMQGFHRAVAIVTAENEGSIAFHERVGMRRVGTLERCGWKFDRLLGITFLDLDLQDDHHNPGRILPVCEVAG